MPHEPLAANHAQLLGEVVDASSSSTQANMNRHVYLWLGIVLLVAGLMGHVLAARAIGGSSLAYRDHLVGFLALTIVSGAILVAFGRKFWRGRHDLTLLFLGALQAAIGVFVYIERYSVHG